MMIFADLNEDGVLTLSTTDGTTGYALKVWKERFDEKSATLQVVVGQHQSITEWAKQCKKEFKELAAELKKHQTSVIVPNSPDNMEAING